MPPRSDPCFRGNPSLPPALPPIRSLEIPDDYEFMAPELVEILTGAVKTVESTPEKSNRRR